ncbi:MAG: ATP-binding protein [Vicinamibacteria bacterium]
MEGVTLPVAGFALEALGAVLLALFLRSFERSGSWPGLREWSLSLWTLAGALAASVAHAALAAGSPWKPPVLGLSMVLAYWQPALLLIGTWSRWNGHVDGSRLRALLAGLTGLALATTFAPAGDWRPLLRSGTRTLLCAIAFLAACVLLARALRSRARGGRALRGGWLLALAFLGSGIEDVFFTGTALAGFAGWQPRLMGQVAERLVEFELLLLMITGVGMVAWLLEEEREVALQADLALRSSEEKYRVLFANNPEPTWVYDEETLAILDVNDAAVARYGFSRDEFLRLTIEDVRPPEELPRLRRRLQRMPDSLADTEVWTHRRKDGSGLLVETSSHRLLLGDRRARITIVHDVTLREQAALERERLQAAITTAAEEWKQTFDSVDVAVLLLTPGGRVARVNRAAAELLGRGIEDCLGAPLAELSDAEPWPSAGRLAAEGQRGAEPAGAVAREPGSGRTWVVSVNRFATARTGEERLVVVLREVTALAQLEESLRRKEAMSAVGSLVAGVAHEVRNPLFGISSTLDAFEARFGAEPGYSRYLGTLRSQVDRLSQLMTDLLEYGKPPSELAPQRLGGVIAEAIHSCAPLAARAGVTIAPPPLVPELAVRMDRARLLQVFQNVIQNAIEHSPRGGVVEVGAGAADDGGLEVRVRDAGAGIDPLDRERLFEPFFSKRRGGIGLGLSIVQRIVEQHSGRVEAGNHPAGGAEMRVWLPGAPPAAASASSQAGAQR